MSMTFHKPKTSLRDRPIKVGKGERVVVRSKVGRVISVVDGPAEVWVSRVYYADVVAAEGLPTEVR